MVPGLRYILDYKYRLIVLNLPILNYHTLRGDIINVRNYLHGILHVTTLHDIFNLAMLSSDYSASPSSDDSR